MAANEFYLLLHRLVAKTSLTSPPWPEVKLPDPVEEAKYHAGNGLKSPREDLCCSIACGGLTKHEEVSLMTGARAFVLHSLVLLSLQLLVLEIWVQHEVSLGYDSL